MATSIFAKFTRGIIVVAKEVALRKEAIDDRTHNGIATCMLNHTYLLVIFPHIQGFVAVINANLMPDSCDDVEKPAPIWQPVC
jgi:hypothetical protein